MCRRIGNPTRSRRSSRADQNGTRSEERNTERKLAADEIRPLAKWVFGVARSMRRILWIFCGSLYVGSVLRAAEPQQLRELPNREASYILANLELLAEAEFPESKAIHVRVYRVADHGECDGTPQSCPLSIIYLTASEYGEYPEQRVFELPKRHDWKFVAWKGLPESDGPRDFVTLELSFSAPSPSPGKGWWTGRTSIVRINYRTAELIDQ